MDIDTEIKQILEAFRQRLIDRLSANRPGAYEAKGIPQLYAMAARRFPCLHQDVELCTLYKALGKIQSGSVDQNDVEMPGINAWIDAGLSPVIYFTGAYRQQNRHASPVSSGRQRAPLCFIELLGVKGARFPSREKLLGNLSLAEFSHFLADRVSFNRMNYYWVRLLTAVMPELIEPSNWINLSTGYIRVKETFRQKKGEPLQALLPLLLIKAGKDPALCRQAKIELNIVDPQAVQSVTRQALHDVEDERGMTTLDRYIQFEYGGWASPALDPVLITHLLSYDFRSRVGHADAKEGLWFTKAVELLEMPCAHSVIWPAAVYARFLMYSCFPDESNPYDNLAKVLEYFPQIKRIQDYVISPSFPLIQCLIETDEFFILVHPVLVAQLDAAHKQSYIDTASSAVADFLVKEMAEDVYFSIDPQVCDPACLGVMSRRVNTTVSVEDLNPSKRGHRQMLALMTCDYKGEGQKPRAIQWCASIGSQTIRLEAMQLLDLTLEEVSLAPELHDEFLSRDLGL